MASSRRTSAATPPPAATVFTPASLKFLRSLARNNDRLWFAERKATFERDVKAPMLAVVEHVNAVLDAVAPAHVRMPHKALMRIHRDTRFSKNKLPLKTHQGAWWGLPGQKSADGPGFYIHVGAKDVVLAAGIYMPTPEQLLRLRRWFVQEPSAYPALLKKALKAEGMAEEDTLALKRVPRGFDAEAPAAELLKGRRFAVACELPPEAACEPGFRKRVEQAIRAAAPLVVALDGAIGSTAPVEEL